MNAYVNLNNANVLFSNTHNLKLKDESKSEYLKDINYFVDEFNTEKEIQIEIGFGSGRHLLHQAKSKSKYPICGS